jgi:hypothetical protein
MNYPPKVGSFMVTDKPNSQNLVAGIALKVSSLGLLGVRGGYGVKVWGLSATF